MKRLIYSMVILSVTFFMPACNKFTDIVPKGANTLSNVSDLDLVLNMDYILPSFEFTELLWLTDQYPRITNVPNLISTPTKGLTFVLMTYDESLDRAGLTVSDAKYEQLYAMVNKFANLVILNADAAAGDRNKANQYKAEAYILRVYYEYIAVNIYAKAYTPQTAATDGGVPYVEDNAIAKYNEKGTVASVYEKLLADLDHAFQLNALPNVPINKMRVGKAFAYAVKANVLMSMRNYAGALEAAEASLAINNTLADYRRFLPPPNGTGIVSAALYSAPENLFYSSWSTAAPALAAPTLEVFQNYEPESIIGYKGNIYFDNPFSGIPGTKYSNGYGSNTSGLTTADMYLVKAECLARTQKVQDAMSVLNALREKRVFPYSPLIATTEAEAMAYIMRASRTEKIFTYKNFIDLKRWNTEDAYKQTITRAISGVTYTLRPDSKLWVFPFPQNAVNYNPLLTQNY